MRMRSRRVTRGAQPDNVCFHIRPRPVHPWRSDARMAPYISAPLGRTDDTRISAPPMASIAHVWPCLVLFPDPSRPRAFQMLFTHNRCTCACPGTCLLAWLSTLRVGFARQRVLPYPARSLHPCVRACCQRSPLHGCPAYQAGERDTCLDHVPLRLCHTPLSSKRRKTKSAQ